MRAEPSSISMSPTWRRRALFASPTRPGHLASRVVLSTKVVYKKDGSVRFYVDYRDIYLKLLLQYLRRPSPSHSWTAKWWRAAAERCHRGESSHQKSRSLSPSQRLGSKRCSKSACAVQSATPSLALHPPPPPPV
eukprot:scaffold204106_cov31-Tisochrysis_lutea.AAC.1